MDELLEQEKQLVSMYNYTPSTVFKNIMNLFSN